MSSRPAYSQIAKSGAEALRRSFEAGMAQEKKQPDSPEFVDKEDESDVGLDLEEHRLQAEIDQLRQAVKEAEDTHNLRLKYVSRIYWLVVCWLAAVVAAVGFSGFWLWKFSLPENVLIAFITSSTVTVVGLFVVVAKWLFPNGNDPKPHKKTPAE